MEGVLKTWKGVKPCTLANRKTKKEGDGETSEKRIHSEMEISKMEKMKTKEGDGETSEKRIHSEMEISEMKKMKGDGETSEKRIDAEMEISGQLVPTNNSMKKKKKKKKAILIEEGKRVDVKGFLSSKDRDYLVSSKDGTIVPISSLEGKYVLICCLFIPFDLDTTEGSLCQSIQALYSYLQLIDISDSVKLVIVLKLKQDAPAPASAFDSFFSWFPLNCLTIPFWDSQSRHYVCRALGFCPRFHHHPCLAIHSSGLVLWSGSDLLQYYGARSFPFTLMHVKDITRYDNFITHGICSNNNHVILEELLRCDSFSQIADVDNTKSIPISDLIDAPVGLYLYCDGSFMDDLRVLHKSCRDKGLKFDVVVVPLPFVENYDPASFCDRMKQSALEDEISSSWLVFPFDDDICRTLWRITSTLNDRFIILPHGDFCGDLDGRAIVSAYGVDGYPFSKDALVKQKVNHLRSLTLDRLLGKDFTDRCDLHNKNVLLYFDDSWSSRLYKRLIKGYCKIKLQYPDCKVVFVPLKPRFSSADAEIDLAILPAEKCEAVIKHIFTDQLGSTTLRAFGKDGSTTLCAFGKDGKLLSRLAGECLPIQKSSYPLFGDTLYSEIFEDVREELLDHECY